jgi:hypothetical protein
LADDVYGLSPAEILISANFQPDFQLTRSSHTSTPTTNHRDVAMTLSVTKLNHHPQDLFLQSFQMLLVGYTDIQAGTATHGQMRFWTLQSLSNIGLRVFAASDTSGTQHDVNSRLWDNITLDDSVVPDFATCNIERRYELEILMGWQCRSGEHAGRIFFVQVRTPVHISSGIQHSRQLQKDNVWTGREEVEGVTLLHNDESGFSAPPTYDEAVRTTVRDGLEGFEMRSANGY